MPLSPQTRAVPSLDVDARRVPSGENRQCGTICGQGDGVSAKSQEFLKAFAPLMPMSSSWMANAIHVPSGEKARVLPLKAFVSSASSVTVLASASKPTAMLEQQPVIELPRNDSPHKRRCPSMDAVAMCEPSGENTCARFLIRTETSLLFSPHSMSFLLLDTDAIRVPSGEKFNSVIRAPPPIVLSLCSISVDASAARVQQGCRAPGGLRICAFHGLKGLRTPYRDIAISRSYRKHAPVGRKGDGAWVYDSSCTRRKHHVYPTVVLGSDCSAVLCRQIRMR
eukprot:2131899-Prymnesium_polylepis.1